MQILAPRWLIDERNRMMPENSTESTSDLPSTTSDQTDTTGSQRTELTLRSRNGSHMSNHVITPMDNNANLTNENLKETPLARPPTTVRFLLERSGR